MALGYLIGKGTAKLTGEKINIPLILTLSLLPDIDIIIDNLLMLETHRGPTHSIIATVIVFIPLFLIYRKKVIPYFAALASHTIIADFFIGGQLQLLWPLTTNEYGLHELGLPYINIYNSFNIALEFTLFAIAIAIMIKTGDMRSLFRRNRTNLLLAIPLFTVILPTFLSFPLQVHIALVLPHLFYLAIFVAAILIQVIPYF